MSLSFILAPVLMVISQLTAYPLRSHKCYAARDIGSIDEQSGRTTGRLGSTGLQAMPSEGRHRDSWHSGANPPPLSSPGRVTLSDDYGPGAAAGGWTSLPPPPAIA